MKILYVSVHQILEYDEISIFESLGHDVFSLGSYFGTAPSEQFRPVPPLMPALADYMTMFEALGGVYKYGAPASEQVIPRAFAKLFDAVVVMHDLDFIETHWDAFAGIPVIWRSIGVGTDLFEPRVAALRVRGMKIVRYCPTEVGAEHYAGHDAVVRFGKVGADYSWIGNRPELLTFSHAYRQRFPAEYDFYVAATEGIPALLGGASNEGLPSALGIVDFQTQNELFAGCAAYFYASGSFIPYTLNFMEAWLSGIPLVAIDCHGVHAPEHCKFAEVPTLIQHGVNGFLVKTPEEAKEVFRTIQNDPLLARSISVAGASTARSLFSSEVIAPQWRKLFASVA